MDQPTAGIVVERESSWYAAALRTRGLTGLLVFLTAAAAFGLTVNPWSRDGWFQTQYLLVGRFPGYDDYTPIAAPALLYAGAHGIARLLRVGLAGEFYISCALQNLMLLASAGFVYRTLKLLRLESLAAPVTVVFLAFTLSTGVAQWFYSEGTSLFLMAAVILALVSILTGGAEPPARFWRVTIVCGILLALLVATRMTPLFLIPGAALLLVRRISFRRLVQLTGTLTAITAATLAGMMLANHARFGRYELTNSTGRHLWQGVKDFSDRALAGSARYQALKRLEPHVQGKFWDEIPPLTDDVTRVDPREPLLRDLAKQAIRNAPGLYLLHGATKFVRTIGRPPTRDAFFRLPGVWNPLHRTKNLPSLLDRIGAPPALSRAVDATYRAVYAAFDWLYPVSIFAIAMTCLAALLQGIHGRRSVGRLRRAALAIFYGVGIALACIPLTSVATRPGRISACAACALLLGACGALLDRTLRDAATAEPVSLPATAEPRGAPIRLLLVSALLFFGTLWFTWQVEVGSPRYALPFLPLWAIMLAIALRYWRELDARRATARSPALSAA